MNLPLPLSAVLAIAVAAASASASSQDAPSGTQAPAIPSGIEEVQLDVVIHGKNGKPVNDIEPDDLTAFDNGVKQAITRLRLVEGGDTLSNSGAVTPLDPLGQVWPVTLVFETMADDDLRNPARNASGPLVSPTTASQPATNTSQTQGANSGGEANRRRTAQKGALELLKDAPPRALGLRLSCRNPIESRWS